MPRATRCTSNWIINIPKEKMGWAEKIGCDMSQTNKNLLSDRKKKYQDCERPGILYRQDGKGYNFVLRGQDHLWRNFWIDWKIDDNHL